MIKGTQNRTLWNTWAEMDLTDFKIRLCHKLCRSSFLLFGNSLLCKREVPPITLSNQELQAEFSPPVKQLWGHGWPSGKGDSLSHICAGSCFDMFLNPVKTVLDVIPAREPLLRHAPAFPVSNREITNVFFRQLCSITSAGTFVPSAAVQLSVVVANQLWFLFFVCFFFTQETDRFSWNAVINVEVFRFSPNHLEVLKHGRRDQSSSKQLHACPAATAHM